MVSSEAENMPPMPKSPAPPAVPIDLGGRLASALGMLEAGLSWISALILAVLLAIVLASASVITGVTLLAWAAGGLGLLGTALSLLGWFAPDVIERVLG